MALSPLTIGPARFRAGAWRGSRDTAYLVPLTGAVTLDAAVLGRARAALIADGYRDVVTAAVAPPEAAALRQDGFERRESLHLLRHRLDPIPRPPTPSDRVRRGTSRDHGAVLALDGRAFDVFWRLDADGLQEALDATPVSRLRVAQRGLIPDPARISGYAVAGRAGRQGYLQRLAVDPEVQGGGIGAALVVDVLRWLRRRGAVSVMVNTQEHNHRALALYERLGFTHEPHQLTVLHRSLG